MMKNELIDKLLNGQATPEEEHLIARMLRREEDVEAWLAEDETATYNLIIYRRRARRRMAYWAAAAVVVAVLAAGAVLLWPRGESPVVREAVVAQNTATVPAAACHPVVATAPVPVRAQHVASKPVKARGARPAATAADSLQYYIARLEHELEQVTDSNYTAKAEQIIRADARLQRLVQRIMIGEIQRSDMPVEAMNRDETMEDMP
ncbi:MAG: hypothetical protein IJ144_01110 [Prevotella sp.]|nr:hypothetical protein [Prevotella sp.]